MKRLYFVSDDLDELETVESKLENAGIEADHIHVLSNDDLEVEKHHLHGVNYVSKSDFVHSAFKGLFIGVGGAGLLLGIFYLNGVQNSIGWAPAVFISILFMCFCIWEGGLWGIQNTNVEFVQFENLLDKGQHVFFVDVLPNQKDQVLGVTGVHPKVSPVGEGHSSFM